MATTSMPGIGDVLMLSQLSWKLERVFSPKGNDQAPADFLEIEAQLDNLTKALKALAEAMFSEDDNLLFQADSHTQQGFTTIFKTCRRTLRGLNGLVDKYQVTRRTEEAHGITMERDWADHIFFNYKKMMWTSEGGTIDTLRGALHKHSYAISQTVRALDSGSAWRLAQTITPMAEQINDVRGVDLADKIERVQRYVLSFTDEAVAPMLFPERSGSAASSSSNYSQHTNGGRPSVVDSESPLSHTPDLVGSEASTTDSPIRTLNDFSIGLPATTTATTAPSTTAPSSTLHSRDNTMEFVTAPSPQDTEDIYFYHDPTGELQLRKEDNPLYLAPIAFDRTKPNKATAPLPPLPPPTASLPPLPPSANAPIIPVTTLPTVPTLTIPKQRPAMRRIQSPTSHMRSGSAPTRPLPAPPTSHPTRTLRSNSTPCVVREPRLKAAPSHIASVQNVSSTVPRTPSPVSPMVAEPPKGRVLHSDRKLPPPGRPSFRTLHSAAAAANAAATTTSVFTAPRKSARHSLGPVSPTATEEPRPQVHARSNSAMAVTRAPVAVEQTPVDFERALFANSAILCDLPASCVEYTVQTREPGKGLESRVETVTSQPCRVCVVRKRERGADGVARFTTSIWTLANDKTFRVQHEVRDGEAIIPYCSYFNPEKVAVTIPSELRFHGDRYGGPILHSVATRWTNYIFADTRASTVFQSVLFGRTLTKVYRTEKTIRIREGLKGAIALQEQMCAMENLRIWAEEDGTGRGAILAMLHFSAGFRDGYLTFWLNNSTEPVRVKDEGGKGVRIKGLNIPLDGTRGTNGQIRKNYNPSKRSGSLPCLNEPNLPPTPMTAVPIITDLKESKKITGAKVEFRTINEKNEFLSLVRQVQDQMVNVPDSVQI